MRAVLYCRHAHHGMQRDDAAKVQAVAAIVSREWGITKGEVPSECLLVAGMCGVSVAGSEELLGAKYESLTVRSKTRATWNISKAKAMGVAFLVQSKGYHSKLPAVRRELLTVFTKNADFKCGDAESILLLAGLQDDWSATRKIAAKVFNSIDPPSSLVDELHKLLSSPAWHVVEGALLALNNVHKHAPLPLLDSHYTSLHTELCEEALQHVDYFSVCTPLCPPPLDVFLVMTQHLTHQQVSVSEACATLVLTLASNSCTLFALRLFKYLLHMLKSPQECSGIFLVLQGLVPRLPPLCLRDMVYEVSQLLHSGSSVTRQTAASVLVACCTQDEDRVHDVMDNILNMGSSDWELQEGMLFVLEELLLRSLVPRQYLVPLVNVVSCGDKFELKRMKSQVIPHLATCIVQENVNISEEVAMNDELAFWVLWKENSMKLSVGHVSSPKCVSGFWGVSRQLAHAAYVSRRMSSQAIRHLPDIIDDTNSTPVLTRILADAVPTVVSYSDLSVVVNCIVQMLKSTVDVNGACNLLEALRRCAMLLKDTETLLFPASPILNTVSLTESDRTSWGDVVRGRITANPKNLKHDAPKEDIADTIVTCCCKVLSRKNTETCICKAVLQVLSTGDLKSCSVRLISSIKKRMEAEGFQLVNGAVFSPTTTALHDWDRDSDSDDEGGEEGFISRWKPDLAACLSTLDPVPPCEVSKWILT
eukprot:TRINITY_DN7331_c0_g1_i1.p1 TRINITY_DN7331_c0_g1~~TRINITY_DN7331_c0_g1_i1.p1  ORF type:complete len:705 (+),score=161.72 TRINITY_DN7331_c0_g1_i1:809-2923(+)